MGGLLTTLVAVGTLLVLYRQGAFNLTGLTGTTPGTVPPPPAVAAPPSATVVTAPQTDSTIASGVATGVSLIPVVGPVAGAAFKALTSVLLSASAARAKAAINENTAVAAAVPGWDQAIAQITATYNNGSISVAQAQQAYVLALTNYWAEVTPKIQSGRNGCNGGQSCPGSPNPSSSQTTNEGGGNYCSGSIGAACCVGCADLNLSTANLQWALSQNAKSGVSTNAFIQTVYASKYGGVNRAAYNVYFTIT
jgi:hypothetical protein